jgi:hypothetical protein
MKYVNLDVRKPNNSLESKILLKPTIRIKLKKKLQIEN